ncbi:MBL fold metallo-hydrolase [Actinomadura chibensis]|uniref:MBL fold metallo-hydrolase n=1 Tax=Actinomadura chibensis TaxID=392828 RepID=A0A5D0NEE9_9ACTN|nr:MBL fold metallo-hydrolase [Actinomadura chibensis]TYB42679.1 MBL fold metallo-hydrolase [Actinomadura chibensis]
MTSAPGPAAGVAPDGVALAPVLRAAAVAVLERPSASRLPSDPDALVAERTPMLLAALVRFPALRRRAAVLLAEAAPAADARALAAALLHPDDAVARAAQAWLAPAPAPAAERAADRAERRADRAARRADELRKRLREARGRLEYAKRDAATATRRLTETREALTAARAALAEQKARADGLDRRLTAERRRWTNPRALAAALLTTLEHPTPENQPTTTQNAPTAAKNTPTPTKNTPPTRDAPVAAKNASTEAKKASTATKDLPTATKNAPTTRDAPAATRKASTAAKNAPTATRNAPMANRDVPAEAKKASTAAKDVPAATKNAPTATRDAPTAAKDGAPAAKDGAAAAKDVPGGSKGDPTALKGVPAGAEGSPAVSGESLVASGEASAASDSAFAGAVGASAALKNVPAASKGVPTPLKNMPAVLKGAPPRSGEAVAALGEASVVSDGASGGVRDVSVSAGGAPVDVDDGAVVSDGVSGEVGAESVIVGDGALGVAARGVGVSPGAVLGVLRALAEPAASVVATAELGLRVVPLGGDDHIGGSCVLVEAGGTRILIDAGLRPGDRAEPPRDIARALDGPLDAVVVTHAHNDHCGHVPALVARRPGLRVIATPETVALMPVMWADTAKVMAARERGRARWGAEAAVLYGPREIDAASRRREALQPGMPRRIGALTVELFPAGHVLGAAGVVVRAGDRRVVVTGDISGFRQETVGGYAVPESARGADLLVMESTCCAEEHDARDLRVDELVRAVAEVHGRGGRVLIPAFALGRAQEIALIMRRRLPEVPVRVDGMAVDLAAVFESLDPGIRIFTGGTAAADRPADLDDFRTGVVISTSGMLTGGPVVEWAQRVLPEPGSALFISGYQDEESPGRALLDLASSGGAVTLPDRDGEVTVPVRARVETMRLSAHADRRGLLDIAGEVAAAETMLVHGVPKRQRTFAATLGVRGHRVAETTAWRPAGTP